MHEDRDNTSLTESSAAAGDGGLNWSAVTLQSCMATATPTDDDGAASSLGVSYFCVNIPISIVWQRKYTYVYTWIYVYIRGLGVL